MKNVLKFKPLQIRWKEALGLPECPYMIRWVFNFGLFSIRLHVWKRSDDKRFFHDHPWNSLIFCIRGGYTDVSEQGEETFWSGQIRYMSAIHRHYVKVSDIGATTLLLCGPPIRNWGYWVGETFKRPLKYFNKFGHPPCHED